MANLRRARAGATPLPCATIETGRSTLRFYLGDCLDVMQALKPGSVSAIVTSPPYNLRIRYRSYADTLPREEYLRWTARWLSAARAALDDQGSLFLNVGPSRPTRGPPWTSRRSPGSVSSCRTPSIG